MPVFTWNDKSIVTGSHSLTRLLVVDVDVNITGAAGQIYTTRPAYFRNGPVFLTFLPRLFPSRRKIRIDRKGEMVFNFCCFHRGELGCLVPKYPESRDVNNAA